VTPEDQMKARILRAEIVFHGLKTWNKQTIIKENFAIFCSRTTPCKDY
jgi:hypothetical protein